MVMRTMGKTLSRENKWQFGGRIIINLIKKVFIESGGFVKVLKKVRE